jgi:hypothetical protein
MNSVKKFAYTTGDLFFLSGDYVGFYNIKDGIGYAGKYSQNIELINILKVQNIIARSNQFYNRLPTQNFTLTYTLSDFVFQPNEFINGNALDNKLNKLYINFLDSYRACFMASSNLPYDLTQMAKVSATNLGTNFAWTSSSNGTAVLALSTINSAFTRDSKIVYATNIYSDNDTLILANSASLFAYKIYEPDSTFTFNFSSSYIETTTPDYGALTFDNITSVSLFENKFYVCDNGNKTVYYYDIISVLQEDRALGNKFNLVDSIDTIQGGFESPQLVCAGQDFVYIYDNFLKTIFFYDINFNLINSYKNADLFSSSIPSSMSFYRVYNELYVITEDFKLIILDNQANARIIQLSTKGIQPDEYAKKIIFSNTNSDILYLLSNKNLYKKFVSNIIDNIGLYSFTQYVTGNNTNLFGDLLYDIDILQTNVNVDNILLYGFNQLINYNEVTIFNSIIK